MTVATLELSARFGGGGGGGGSGGGGGGGVGDSKTRLTGSVERKGPTHTRR